MRVNVQAWNYKQKRAILGEAGETTLARQRRLVNMPPVPRDDSSSQLMDFGAEDFDYGMPGTDPGEFRQDPGWFRTDEGMARFDAEV